MCRRRHLIFQDSCAIFRVLSPRPPKYFHNNLSQKTHSYKTGKLWGLAYHPTSQSARGSAVVSERNTGPLLSPRSGALQTRPGSTSPFRVGKQNAGRHLKLENRASLPLFQVQGYFHQPSFLSLSPSLLSTPPSTSLLLPCNC